MDTSALGKKIKEARLSKKMTQAEVVGDFITRNMLSQIESGSATPSVKTLEYLCRALDLPLTLLTVDEEPQVLQESLSVLAKVRDFYLSERYEDVIALDDTTGAFSDEFSAIKAKSSLKLAQSLASGTAVDLQMAVEYAKAAAELSEQGIYSNEAVKSEAMRLLSDLASQLADYYKSLVIG